MNKRVKTANLEEILFFDIETVRKQKELDINSREYDLYAWHLRDKDSSELPEASVVIEDYKNKAALYPAFNKIVCISVGFIKKGNLFVKSFTGEQSDIIEQFYSLVNKMPNYKLCGHNIIGYDLPILRLKALEEGLDLEYIHPNINDCGAKPWTIDENLFDTMSIAKGTYFYNISLDQLAYICGIETSKTDLDGSKVSEEYWENGVSRIEEYCKHDVRVVAQIFCKLANKSDCIETVIFRV